MILVHTNSFTPSDKYFINKMDATILLWGIGVVGNPIQQFNTEYYFGNYSFVRSEKVKLCYAYILIYAYS